MAKARDVTVRVAVAEAEQAIARLRAIGQTGEQAFQRLARGASTSSAEVTRDLTRLEAALGGARSATVRFAQGFATGALGAAGLYGFTSVVTRMVQEVREAEDSQVRLAAVLRATGGTAGLTARQLGTFADELEGSTLQSAEAIKDASSVLATFKSVSGETFTDAIRLSCWVKSSRRRWPVSRASR